MAKYKLNHKMLGQAAYQLGLSTYQLAAQSGVAQPTVSSILRGEKSPSSDKLKAICEVLDLDINDVFELAQEKAAA